MGSGWRAVAVVTGASLLAVLVAWGALIGPERVFTGPGPTPSTEGTTTTATEPPEGDSLREKARRAARDAEPPLWLKLLVWTFELAVLAATAALAVLLLRRAREAWLQRRRRRGPPPVERDFDLLEPTERGQEAVRADTDAQDRVLREGSPRNAIVATWHRFELQGARAGVDRHDWETTSEYALRFLDLAGADSVAVGRLAGLYREARFSDHALDETHRAAAAGALADIRRSLRGGTL